GVTETTGSTVALTDTEGATEVAGEGVGSVVLFPHPDTRNGTSTSAPRTATAIIAHGFGFAVSPSFVTAASSDGSFSGGPVGFDGAWIVDVTAPVSPRSSSESGPRTIGAKTGGAPFHPRSARTASRASSISRA